MKISIAYLPEEQEAVAADLAVLLRQHPGIKIRKSDRHAPYKHVYLTTKKPVNPLDSKENT